MRLANFSDAGWLKFHSDPRLLDWLHCAGPQALATRYDPAMVKDWLRCQQTWFIGVNALANGADGAIGKSGPLAGEAIDFVRGELQFGNRDLDRAQVSIAYPGYPKPHQSESEQSFQFRLKRDAAHIDGLHPVGPKRRRKVLEFQGFLLGIPVTQTTPDAAPLVVWEGSHRVLGRAIRHALGHLPVDAWPDTDLTDVYHQARQLVFETCRRVVVHAKPGEAYVVHRLALHGIAPWSVAAKAPPEGRAVLYFRPEIDRARWLNDD